MKLNRDLVCVLTLGLLTSVSSRVIAQTPLISKVSKTSDGVSFSSSTGTNRIEIWNDRIVRVIHGPGKAGTLPTSLTVIAKPAKVNWKFVDGAKEAVITTKLVQVRINKLTGQIRFLNLQGSPLLGEAPNGTSFAPNSVGTARNTLAVTQRFALDPAEGIYGLGQHQDGLMNQAGHIVHLQQENTKVAIPVLLSSKGYLVLWDNPAVTDVDAGKTDSKTLSWKSEAGAGVDYYFVAGPEPDQAIAGYRWLTGAAPMFGKWAWGFWQSKERYQTQDELVGVVSEYRRRGIPLDGVIQDWHYWPDLNQETAENGWGSHIFDPARYPDPKAMVKAIHGQHAHVMVVSWGKFETTRSGKSIPNLKELEAVGGVLKPASGYVFPNTDRYYDPFNKTARAVYWKRVSKQLFSTGMDAWWLDASEPELAGRWGELRDFSTSQGPAPLVFNAYPLEHTRTVYEGQRSETSAKRVLILTRSAYAGQQRNAAITWSGDIGANWDIFQNQIKGGLNFTASGIPYWNTDIGGFFSGNPADPYYRELFTRWFQFGAFNPMFRVHGTNYPKEVWRFDEPTQKILTDTINLRYHLLPYIYSTSWKVTNQGYTMMRPLVMDFRADAKTRNIGDQFMFGPSLLVCPVTESMSPIPAQIPTARLIDTQGSPGGLTGSYYRGMNFEAKVTERKDANLSFNWGEGPVPGLERTHFSVRWEGELLTNKAGTYTFNLGADDGLRLWVNGKLLVEDWASRAYSLKSGTIGLPANTRVPIKVEYYQNEFDAKVDLTWIEPGGKKRVPARSVYLPSGTKWSDFWTGETKVGGQTLEAAAPIDRLPLYVRAGSILPLGPTVQYATQNPGGPVELRVYPGANGSFNLYEDEGDNYDYERGVYSTIPIQWNDKSNTLTIGARKGTFPGMIKNRTFRVVWVTKGHGNGGGLTGKPDVEVKYSGKAVSLHR